MMPLLRRATIPAPFVVAPTQAWDGNDGPWSSFTYGIGTPAQWPRVLISTSAVQPWAVLEQGCTRKDPVDCPDSRGSLFKPNSSTTWQDQGLFTLISGTNYGINANANFGFDTMTLGLPGSANTAVLKRQIVAGIAAKDFYMANWGLRPYPTNLTSLNDPIPSLLSTLASQRIIPSRSWGYTAGAYYMSLQNKGSLGSLVLGGYDASRFSGDRVSFPMGPDTSRDLLVGLQSISIQDNGRYRTPQSLLPTKALAFIDSGVSHMWLLTDACKAFESAFGLQWNEQLKLYLVNSTQHSALVSQNASVTLTLGSTLDSQPTVDITMPYSSFDLTLNAHYPGIANDTAYFPLRRAANASQVTLGRVFLQNAYVAADYERMLFSVNPAVFPDAAAQQIRPILTVADAAANGTGASFSSSGALPVGATVGAAVGGLVALFALCAGAFFLWRRVRRRRGERLGPRDGRGGATGRKGKPGAGHEAAASDVELDAPDAGLAGLYVGELADSARKSELAASETPGSASELPSPGLPPPLYASGRLKSEMPGTPVGRAAWEGIKSVNDEVSELPGSPYEPPRSENGSEHR